MRDEHRIMINGVPWALFTVVHNAPSKSCEWILARDVQVSCYGANFMTRSWMQGDGEGREPKTNK
jgi:hypothetical protein